MPDSSANSALLSLEHVCVEHIESDQRRVVALDDVTLTIEAGERVALLGPSGSGKTSLLDVIAGRIRPVAGRVTVLGEDPAAAVRAGARRRRAFGRRVGVVRQHGDLVLPLRVVHNVNAGVLGHWSTWRAVGSLLRPSGRADVDAVLRRVGLADRIDTTTGDLSGGERQRVAIARVLRQRPDVVLADEPTSSVDPALADSVLTELAGSAATWTLVAALHDPELALRHASRLVGMRHGRIVFELPPDRVDQDDIAALYRPADDPTQS